MCVLLYAKAAHMATLVIVLPKELNVSLRHQGDTQDLKKITKKNGWGGLTGTFWGHFTHIYRIFYLTDNLN